MKFMVVRNWLLVETLEYIDHNNEPAEIWFIDWYYGRKRV